jgi:hypothetical protein
MPSSSFSNPKLFNTRTAFGPISTPAPTVPNLAACSYKSKDIPYRKQASAKVNPPNPPPIIMILNSDDIRFYVASDLVSALLLCGIFQSHVLVRSAAVSPQLATPLRSLSSDRIPGRIGSSDVTLSDQGRRIEL